MASHFPRHVPKRRTAPSHDEEQGELSLVPYLDILMNLIIFVLMSITGLATYGVLNVTAPGYGAPAAGRADAPAQLERLQLSVHVARNGFYLASNRALAAPGTQDGAAAGGRVPTIPLRADGTHDFAALTARLVQVKDAYPTESAIVLAAEPDVSYDVLVQVMDAVRETPGPRRRLLFPDVNLGELLDG